MKKILLLFFIAIGSLNLQSCADNESYDFNEVNESQIIAKTILPTKIDYGDGFIEFKYDNNDRFTQINNRNNYGSFKIKNEFYYLGDQIDRIITTYYTDMSTYTINFTHSSDTIYLEKEYSKGSIYKEKLIINKQGALIGIKGESKLSDKIFQIDDYGNITYFGGGGVSGNVTYNSSNGVFKNVNLPIWLKAYISGYNIFPLPTLSYNYLNNVTLIDYISDSWVDERFLYKFDKNNYPVILQHTHSLGKTVLEIEYSN